VLKKAPLFGLVGKVADVVESQPIKAVVDVDVPAT
jgi:hypothetical protein